MYLPKQFQKPPITVHSDGENEVIVNVQQGSSSDPADEKAAIRGRGIKSRYQLEAKQGREEEQKPLVAEEDTQPVQASSSYDPPPDSDLAGDLENQIEVKPLSRAERRKKIKEEVLAAGEGDGFKGYRRRMW